MTVTTYQWAKGWELGYDTTEDLSDATGAAFRLTGGSGADLVIPAEIEAITGGWRVAHTVTAAEIPRGRYTIVPQVDFGPDISLPMEPRHIIIL
ncbi:MAG: hypothetical protein KA745_00145 [Gemmatimonadales bacterium]|nr:hypothetical protein [Gemmatimonadales bacterium]